MVRLIQNYFNVLFGLYDDLDYAARLHTVRTGDNHEPVNSLHKKEGRKLW
jgi:hypothetical protein